MKFLIDNAVSPKIAEALRKLGHDAVHVLEIGLEAASDNALIVLAAEQDRVIISIDTDFGALLAASSDAKPSIVLVRRRSGRNSQRLIDLLRQNLPPLESILSAGAIVVMEEGRNPRKAVADREQYGVTLSRAKGKDELTANKCRR